MKLKDIHIIYNKELLQTIFKYINNHFFDCWKNNWINPDYELTLFDNDKLCKTKRLNNNLFMLLHWDDKVGYYISHKDYELYLKEFLFNLQDYIHIYSFDAVSASALFEQTAKNNLYLFIAAYKAESQYVLGEIAEEMLLAFVEFLRQLHTTGNLSLIPL